MRNITIFLLIIFAASKCPCIDNDKEAEKTKKSDHKQTEKIDKKAPVKDEVNIDLKQPEKDQKIEIKKSLEPVKKLDLDQNILIKKLSEIIFKLENNYSPAKQKLKSIETEKVINAFLKSLKIGVKYSEKGLTKKEKPGKNKKKEKDKKNKKYKGILVADNKILYLRLDSFSPDAFKQLQEDCQNTSRLANKPKGIVIDLRECDSYDNHKEILQALALFCAKNKIPSNIDNKVIKREYNLPMTVLIGEKTSGDGEIFTSSLMEAKQCLAIGEYTAGKPFHWKSEKLQNGGYLLFPEIPDYFKKNALGALKPDIMIKAYPQVEFSKISVDTEDEHKDKCLQRGVDLLISLDALGKKWNKK